MKILQEKKLSEKAIKKINADPFAICGSDNTVKILHFEGKTLSKKSEFTLNNSINSIAAYENAMVVGNQNGEVFYKKGSGEFISMYSHTNNVCSIDIFEDCVLSGSWDHQAIWSKIDKLDECNFSEEDNRSTSVHSNTPNAISPSECQDTKSDNFCSLSESENSDRVNADKIRVSKIIKSSLPISHNETKNVRKRMFAHPESVWCCKIVSQCKFLTGCADGIIRIFENFMITKEISYHQAPVRGLIYEEGIIYSVDNHGNVHKTNCAGELLRCRPTGEFIFGMCRHREYIVVCGETGVILLLNNELEIISRINVDASTAWDVKSVENILYVATNDGRVFLISTEESNDGDTPSEPVTEKFVENEKEENTEVKDGVFTSGGVKYKVEKNKIFIQNGDGWDLIGDTVAKFDHSFPVTLGDKEFTLSFNDKDNIHEVADKFIRQNKLKAEFHDDIVNFIQENYKKNTLFKKYDNIDLAGLSRAIGEDHSIMSFLKDVKEGKSISIFKTDPCNIYQIENILFPKSKLEGGNLQDENPADDKLESVSTSKELPLFIIFDICKFLVSKKLPIDLSFLFKIQISNNKEAKAFTFLMTNIVASPPFRITLLDRKLKKFKDERLISKEDAHDYMENMQVISNKK